MRCVALLRGVNVGGVKVPMAELRALLEGAGFGNVASVLASGNVLFDTGDAPAAVAARLEQLVGERFGYTARILVLPLADVERAAAAYPFDRSDDQHAYVVFTDGPETAGALAAAAAELPPGDKVRADGAVLYWTVAKGSTLDSPFGKLLGKRRAEFTTTRNLRTLAKILAAG